ncbi:MAG TPA: trypsin-like peptidase domain-containing protein [Chthonomonadaceae bacterium]|nr:trypsin-like peptidase domain-containing protein [Chthonomonadaceae bacterium]
MGVRRILGFGLVFGLGIAVGMLMLRTTVVRPATLAEAQRHALQILDQPPVGFRVSDNKIVSAVQRIEPAVVNIDTVGRIHTDDDTGVPWMLDQEVRGKGSGVILTPDGYILTNNHVIDGASRIRVTLPDNRWFYARLVGRDPQTDLAVVRIEASNLHAAELGDSDQLQVGEWCIAVGNPLGLGSTVTVGVISALNRRNLQIDENHTLDGAIQTDAAINRGNSGGALANINGQLIGINTAILSSGPNGGNIGLGFAIPVNTVRRVARELIQNGRARTNVVKHPWLGIQYGAVPEEVAQSLGLSPDRGVLIRRVLPESPASLAGLHDEDIILSIDGKIIGDERDVKEAVLQRKIGDKALVHILRPADRHERDVRVTLQEGPEHIPPAP